MIHAIKFTRRTRSMPKRLKGYNELVGVSVCSSSDLSNKFVQLNNAYDIEISDEWRVYGMQSKKYMVLFILTEKFIWSSIRTWSSGKEKYYRSLIGKQVMIELNDVQLQFSANEGR